MNLLEVSYTVYMELKRTFKFQQLISNDLAQKKLLQIGLLSENVQSHLHKSRT